MTAAPEKCPKCYLPKNPKGSGSLTQWLSSCACDRRPVEPADLKDDSVIQLCKVCGKRAREGRVGSFTQFIFRYDLCSCAQPVFAGQAAAVAPPAMFDPGEPFDDSEDEVPVDATDFPVERYKPIELKGKGASGSVYVCRDRFLNKKVAVKILHRLGKADVLAFQHEAQVLSKLEHPNIVKLLDFGITSGGSPYMVLEYTDGTSLQTRLETDGPLTWKEARSVFVQLADVLIYCHERKVFHRDLKPENILFVNQSGQFVVKLIDFGIAFVKQDVPGGGVENSLAGTPSYMPPDQALGLEYDARSEIYSLGCVVYEALTGRPPFVADTAIELMSMHVNDTAPPLSTYTDADMSQAEAFLAKCLAKKPGDRFFSMKRVVEALKKSDLRDRAAASENSSAEAESDPSTLIPLPSAIPLAAPSSNNRARITILLTVLLALGMGVLAVVQLTRNSGTKVANQPVETYKAETKVTKEHEQFTLEETKPGFFMAKGTIDEAAIMQIEKQKIKKLQISPSAEVDWKLLPMLQDARINDLNLHFTQVDDDALQYLVPLRFLRHLNVSETKITDEGVKTLCAIRHMKVLVLSNTAVTGACLKYLRKSPFLIHLFISGIHNLTPDDLTVLGRLPALNKLDVSNNPIGDEGAKIVSRMSINNLEMNDCGLSDEGIVYLSSAPLVILAIGGNPKLTNHSLEIIQNFKTLKVLRITGVPQISDKAIRNLQRNRPDLVILRESEYQMRGSKLEELLDTDGNDALFKQAYPDL